MCNVIRLTGLVTTGGGGGGGGGGQGQEYLTSLCYISQPLTVEALASAADHKPGDLCSRQERWSRLD